MNNRQRDYLISTAEDFFYANVSNLDAIAMEVAMTADRHNINLTQSDLVDIVMEARLNYAKGKRTKGGLFGWTGI